MFDHIAKENKKEREQYRKITGAYSDVWNVWNSV